IPLSASCGMLTRSRRMWRSDDARFSTLPPPTRYRAAPLLRQESASAIGHVALWCPPVSDGGPYLSATNLAAPPGARIGHRQKGATPASRHREREGSGAARVGNPPDSAVRPRRHWGRAEYRATRVPRGRAGEPGVTAVDCRGAGTDAAMDA